MCFCVVEKTADLQKVSHFYGFKIVCDFFFDRPEALFDLASDGKAELVTSKQSQARRMNALENVLSQYMPSLKTKSQPILSANEALHCS